MAAPSRQHHPGNTQAAQQQPVYPPSLNLHQRPYRTRRHSGVASSPPACRRATGRVRAAPQIFEAGPAPAPALLHAAARMGAKNRLAGCGAAAPAVKPTIAKAASKAEPKAALKAARRVDQGQGSKSRDAVLDHLEAPDVKSVQAAVPYLTEIHQHYRETEGLKRASPSMSKQTDIGSSPAPPASPQVTQAHPPPASPNHHEGELFRCSSPPRSRGTASPGRSPISGYGTTSLASTPRGKKSHAARPCSGSSAAQLGLVVSLADTSLSSLEAAPAAEAGGAADLPGEDDARSDAGSVVCLCCELGGSPLGNEILLCDGQARVPRQRYGAAPLHACSFAPKEYEYIYYSMSACVDPDA